MMPVSPGRNSIVLSACWRKFWRRSFWSRMLLRLLRVAQRIDLRSLGSARLMQVLPRELQNALAIDFLRARMPLMTNEVLELLLECERAAALTGNDGLRLRAADVELEMQRARLALPDELVVQLARQLARQIEDRQTHDLVFNPALQRFDPLADLRVQPVRRVLIGIGYRL